MLQIWALEAVSKSSCNVGLQTYWSDALCMHCWDKTSNPTLECCLHTIPTCTSHTGVLIAYHTHMYIPHTHKKSCELLHLSSVCSLLGCLSSALMKVQFWQSLPQQWDVGVPRIIQHITSMPTFETPTRAVVTLRTTACCAVGHFGQVAQPRQIIAIEVFPAG